MPDAERNQSPRETNTPVTCRTSRREQRTDAAGLYSVRCSAIPVPLQSAATRRRRTEKEVPYRLAALLRTWRASGVAAGGRAASHKVAAPATALFRQDARELGADGEDGDDNDDGQEEVAADRMGSVARRSCSVFWRCRRSDGWAAAPSESTCSWACSRPRPSPRTRPSASPSVAGSHVTHCLTIMIRILAHKHVTPAPLTWPAF